MVNYTTTYLPTDVTSVHASSEGIVKSIMNVTSMRGTSCVRFAFLSAEIQGCAVACDEHYCNNRNYQGYMQCPLEIYSSRV